MKLKQMVECIKHGSHRDLDIGTDYEVFRTLHDDASGEVFYELCRVNGLIPTTWFKPSLKYYTGERDRLLKCNEDCNNEIESRYKSIRDNNEQLVLLKDKIALLQPATCAPPPQQPYDPLSDL